MSKFTTDNTEGFSQADCDTLNAAVNALVAQGYEPDHAGDLVNNAWAADDNLNTVKQIVARVTGEQPDDEPLPDYHLIAVPHQSPVAIWQPGTYTQSEVADLHIGFPVRDQDDIDAAMRWAGHRAFEVHAAAEKLAELLGLVVR